MTRGGSGLPFSACRICRADDLELILDLGDQPLANSFVRPEASTAAETHYPLELCRCGQCGHVQLSVTVPPEVMFRSYPYVSGVSKTLTDHFQAYAKEIEARFLGPRSFVVEIGSNDGTLLRGFDRAKTRTLGVEPATNIATLANDQGIETLPEFFDEQVASHIKATYGRADAVLANNVVAHVDDLRGLVEAVRGLLSPEGVFVAEFPYLIDLIDHVEYDTIYHEHLSFFSLRAAADLMRRSGLTLFDVQRVATHGGSLRIYAGRDRGATERLNALAEAEAAFGLDSATPFEQFARRVAQQREELVAMINSLRLEGARLAAYGAAAKGNTLLNYCGLSSAHIAFVADRSPFKQGMLTPGSLIPVRPPEALLEQQPEYTLLLAWNMEREVLAQQDRYRQLGGRFIVPIPLPRIV